MAGTAIVTCSLSRELDKKMREKKLSPSECLAYGVIGKLGQNAEITERAMLGEKVKKLENALGMWIKRCRELEERVILLDAGEKNDGK